MDYGLKLISITTILFSVHIFNTCKSENNNNNNNNNNNLIRIITSSIPTKSHGDALLHNDVSKTDVSGDVARHLLYDASRHATSVLKQHRTNNTSTSNGNGNGSGSTSNGSTSTTNGQRQRRQQAPPPPPSRHSNTPNYNNYDDSNTSATVASDSDAADAADASSSSAGSGNSVNPAGTGTHYGGMKSPRHDVQFQVRQDDVCDRYDVDGCSIPFQLPFFYKRLFTPSCYRHDICYHCGISYDVNRVQCDIAFRDNMDIACTSLLHFRYRQTFDTLTLSAKKTRQRRMERLFIAMDQLRGQFDRILHHKMAPVLNKYDTNGYISSEQFQIHVDSIRLEVIQIWARILQQEYLRTWNDTKGAATVNHTKMATTENKNNNLAARQDEQRRAFASTSFSSSDSSQYRNAPKERITTNTTNNNTSSSAVSLLMIQARCSPSIHTGDNYTTSLTRLCSDVLLHLVNVDIATKSHEVVLIEYMDIELIFCHFIKEVYYYAVRIFGDSSYLRTPAFYCGEHFVKQCLPSV